MTDSEKLDLILSEMQGIKTDVQELKQRTTSIETDVQELKQRTTSIETDVQELKQRTTSIETNVADMKLTLENEIRVNIQRVAEGHLDLSRNLHDALKIDNEKEMLAIRVSVLETELRRIKTRLEIA